MNERYIIYEKSQTKYQTAMIAGDSFPTVDELYAYEYTNQHQFRNLMDISRRRIRIHGRRYNFECRGDVCNVDVITSWKLISRPYGYDLDYPFDFNLISTRIISRMICNLAAVAISGTEMLISIVISSDEFVKWNARYDMDPIPTLSFDGGNTPAMDNLGVVLLVARLFQKNVTFQIYVKQIEFRNGLTVNTYVLVKSFYFKQDRNFDADMNRYCHVRRAKKACRTCR